MAYGQNAHICDPLNQFIWLFPDYYYHNTPNNIFKGNPKFLSY